MTIVNIHISDDSSANLDISGVMVSIYDLSSVFQTSAITDSTGDVSISLPDGIYYSYFFKAGVTFLPSQPQQLEVAGPTANNFEIVGHVREEPESEDPDRCTISGYVKGIDGLNNRSRLIFSPVKELIIKSGNVIAPNHRIEIPSDETGYFEFELLRDTKYNAYFLFPQDLFETQPGKLDVQTPNQPRVDLHSLLFPIPVNIDFSASTISLANTAITDESIIVSATFTDRCTRDSINTPWASVVVSNSDPTIADVCISGNKLLILPLSPGSTTVTTTRDISTKVFLDPLPSFTSDTIVITVT